MMKCLSVLICLFVFSTLFISCLNEKEVEFIKQYGQIEGTEFHTPSIGEALLAIADEEGNRVQEYYSANKLYHKYLKEADISIAGCPCDPTGKCLWNRRALIRIINEFKYFDVVEYHLENSAGEIISKSVNRVDSPLKNFSVFEMDGIDNITEKVIFMSFKLRGESEPHRLPINIPDN
ncbi:MAG: hypothetical protein H6577_06245 [Lewinellaceae bacterium]|nr:hypothetical protein [Saprospiraceae bacterium]MCB9337708.1 hypothetical protein [Lewinellaceae bacterium]